MHLKPCHLLFCSPVLYHNSISNTFPRPSQKHDTDCSFSRFHLTYSESWGSHSRRGFSPANEMPPRTTANRSTVSQCNEKKTGGFVRGCPGHRAKATV